MSKRLTAFGLVLVCLLSGCSDQDKYPSGIRKELDDIVLTLPGDFMDLSAEEAAKDATFMYGRKTLVVMGISEKKADLQVKNLAEYTQQVIAANELTCTATPNGDGYLFTYEKNLGDTPYTYTTATYEGSNNFWILQFYGPKDDLQENQPDIDIILESIRKNA